MLPRADLNTTRPPATLEAPTPIVPSGDARKEVFDRLTQIAIGRQLQAEVLSLFEDGTFLVHVADTAARMQLPVGTKVGDNLSMVFVAKDPRPTFLLTAQEGGSAPANLSSVGKLVSQLEQQAQESGTPTAIQPRTPLLLSPAMMKPETVASAMRDSVESSGLFYESHLHDWISGSRPLAEIQREPQAQLPPTSPMPSRLPAGLLPHDLANLDLTKLSASLKELGNGAQVLVNLIKEAQAQAQPAAALQASQSPQTLQAAATDAAVIAQPQQPLPDIQPEAAAIINQQLNVLEHQRVQWHGELWPGMPMEWEISEDRQSRQSPSQEAPESSWSSSVRFSLPTLGDISASIRLVGDRVHVQIDAADDNIAGVLRTEGPSLADALAAAGSPLESFMVKRHGSP